MPRSLLALTIAIAIVATGCSSQWISIALADLPVLAQMALNIGTLVSALGHNKPLSAHDQAAIASISTKAASDLKLLATLYNDYKTASSTMTQSDALDQIRIVASDISANLPAIVAAAQISDPILAAKVTSAVNLIVTTVVSFISLMPQPPPAVIDAKKATQARGLKVKPPTPNELKRSWNREVAPQFTDCGIACGLGNAIGEAKWGQ